MKKILVIEDEAAIRANVLELLEAEDFEAVGAKNGLAGVRWAREHLPDLIICDIMMPELDGYGVLEELRQDPITATIPFIFLTAKAEKSDLRRGMELGADDYLTKPFTRADLLTSIETRLAKQAAVVSRFQQKLQDLRSSVTLSLPHELRTPLTGILGFSEVLIEAYDSMQPREILDMAKIIHAAANRLYRLIENYLLYAELEIIGVDRDKVKALREGSRTIVLKTVVTEAARDKAEQVGREADLTLDLHDAVVPIAETHVKKIVEELLDNAFKYSKAGSPVRVTSRPDGSAVALSVADHGRGMTAEQIAETGAYMQFERKLYEQQGAGLGLTVVRRLVELYGGELTIESTPGASTTVRVILPT